MKRLFAVILPIFCILFCCSCHSAAKDAVRVRLFADDEKERDRLISYVTELLDGAESKEECEKRLSAAGFDCTEEFFEGKKYSNGYYGAGYYLTCRMGEGEKGWQYVAYPSCTYQSLEEYNDAGYRSFFCEIIKKMEERN